MLYESMYVGSFIYQWGFMDGQSGKPQGCLLATQQSPLDNILGDLFGNSGERYFLIEFKTEYAGFHDEVTGAKPARKVLSARFKDAGDGITVLGGDVKLPLREASVWGHFGCWPEKGDLQLDSYIDCINDGHRLPKEEGKLTFSSVQGPLTFDAFYKNINHPDKSIAGVDLCYPGCYRHGFGWPHEVMKAYLKVMFETHPGGS